MNALIIHKQFLPTLALACLTGLASNNALAAANFNSSAKVTYTINNITNSNSSGDLSGLEIIGLSEIDTNQSFEVITGNGSVNPILVNAGSISLTPGIGNIYSRTFELNGSAINSAEVFANYSTWFSLAFKNISTQSSDNYNIDLSLSYELNTQATGDTAFTDINLSYFNLDESASGTEFLDAATDATGWASFTNSRNFNFTLAQGNLETISLKATIGGALVAAPVPVPGTVWLFGSALLAVPRLRKIKSKL